jgi:hypothetical protein
MCFEGVVETVHSRQDGGSGSTDLLGFLARLRGTAGLEPGNRRSETRDLGFDRAGGLACQQCQGRQALGLNSLAD